MTVLNGSRRYTESTAVSMFAKNVCGILLDNSTLWCMLLFYKV